MTIRTNRYYLRIFFWCMDTVVHCMFCVVCAVVQGAEDPAEHAWARGVIANGLWSKAVYLIL